MLERAFMLRSCWSDLVGIGGCEDPNPNLGLVAAASQSRPRGNFKPRRGILAMPQVNPLEKARPARGHVRELEGLWLPSNLIGEMRSAPSQSTLCATVLLGKTRTNRNRSAHYGDAQAAMETRRLAGGEHVLK